MVQEGSSRAVPCPHTCLRYAIRAERAGLGLPGGFVRNAHSLALFLEHEIQQNRVKPWYLHFNKGPDVFSADLPLSVTDVEEVSLNIDVLTTSECG